LQLTCNKVSENIWFSLH